jgi:hypothetical protein
MGKVIDILRLGVIGLGFLLAYMTYQLILHEQQRDPPRKSILTICYGFMAFSIILCVMGFVTQITKGVGTMNPGGIDSAAVKCDLNNRILSFFKNNYQSSNLSSPGEIIGEAKTISKRFLTEQNVTTSVNAEIEKRKKNDPNWLFANRLSDAMALISYLGLAEDTKLQDRIFADMDIPEINLRQ